MALMLVAVEGRYKGWAWDIPARGLLLGRGPENDVVVIDPLVSRRHCRLSSVSESEVRLEDLGSMNPLLVNGTPHREGVLRLGDDVVLGSVRFIVAEDALTAMQALVTHAAANTAVPEGAVNREKSGAIGAFLPVADARGSAIDMADMVFLQESARVMGACSSLHELVGAAAKRLYERFNPAYVWIALVRDDGSLLHLHDCGRQTPPAKLVERALRSREGVLSPSEGTHAGSSFIFTAPVMRHGIPEALVALQTASAAGPHDDSELRLFVLFAQVLEPLLHLVSTNEQLKRENERLRMLAGESDHP